MSTPRWPGKRNKPRYVLPKRVTPFAAETIPQLCRPLADSLTVEDRTVVGTNGWARFVRDHDVLRFETTSKDVKGDCGINKAVEKPCFLCEKNCRYHHTLSGCGAGYVRDFLDRGELRNLGELTLLPNGKRIPGLKLDHPRQLAVMSSLVRFSQVATGDTFTTTELQAAAAEVLGIPVEKFPLGGAHDRPFCSLAARSLYHSQLRLPPSSL